MPLAYGPRAQAIRPTSAADVSVTTWNGLPVTLAAPVTVDGLGRVSFTVSRANRYLVTVNVQGRRSTDLVDLDAGPAPVAGGPAPTADTLEGVGSVGRLLLKAASASAVRAAAETDARYLVVVNHGADAGVARPASAAAVYWIGSVEPTNMTDADLYNGPDA